MVRHNTQPKYKIVFKNKLEKLLLLFCLNLKLTSLKCKRYKITNKYNGIIADVTATIYNIKMKIKLYSQLSEV